MNELLSLYFKTVLFSIFTFVKSCSRNPFFIFVDSQLLFEVERILARFVIKDVRVLIVKALFSFG